MALINAPATPTRIDGRCSHLTTRSNQPVVRSPAGSLISGSIAFRECDHERALACVHLRACVCVCVAVAECTREKKILNQPDFIERVREAARETKQRARLKTEVVMKSQRGSVVDGCKYSVYFDYFCERFCLCTAVWRTKRPSRLHNVGQSMAFLQDMVSRLTEV